MNLSLRDFFLKVGNEIKRSLTTFISSEEDASIYYPWVLPCEMLKKINMNKKIGKHNEHCAVAHRMVQFESYKPKLDMHSE